VEGVQAVNSVILFHLSSHRFSDVVDDFLLPVTDFSGRVVEPPELDRE